jgi:hypothetical protein
VRFVVLALASLVVSGLLHSSVSADPLWRERPVQRQGTRPLPATISTAKVGGEIYVSFNYRELGQPKKFVIEQEVRGRFVFSNVVIPSGTVLVETIPGFYCSEAKLYVDPIAGPWRPVCFQDQDNDRKFDRFGVRPGSIWLWKNPAGMNVPFKLDERSHITLADGGYKKELVFQGVQGDSLKVLYKEFSDDVVQPSFTQELSYPVVNGAATIDFRGLVINVTSISETAMTYQLVSGGL